MAVALLVVGNGKSVVRAKYADAALRYRWNWGANLGKNRNGLSASGL
ncbi:MAG: hypothetical protein ACRD9W_00735 [Terriglobia bacterium]